MIETRGNDRLSRAASAVAKIDEDSWMDYEMDGSGECGGFIAEHHNQSKIKALVALGFTPRTYNDELRARLAPEYPRMSYSTHNLLQVLEVEGEEDYRLNNTFVTTCGEQSSLAFLLGDPS